ncbi:MAG: para-aminobenzoate synthetase component 1 [Patiriisocius sp.]
MNSHKHLIYCQSNKNGKSYLAIGVEEELVLSDTRDSFEALDAFLQNKKSWVFGYMSYDLKNDVEDLKSENHDGLKFPEMVFFRPKLVLQISENEHNVKYNGAGFSDQEIDNILKDLTKKHPTKNEANNYSIKQRTSKNNYLRNTSQILNHIHRGDIYEMNYCHEFFIENIALNPWSIYQKLNALTQAPYSCFMRWENLHVLSGSPELFLEKKGGKIYSKPIKGTIKRGRNIAEDEVLKNELRNDPKERAENVMIVDIVRNDLSRSAKKNSVEVEELCEIYSFETVHQMISTITSEVSDETSGVEVLKHSFPMGSMTGAPKIRAMELIEKLEDFKRGIYSGAIGYFEPDGDFTFNVIIRSILYNSSNKYCSFAAGGALTALSIPEKEYEETLLKAEAMKKSILEHAE